MLQHTPTLQYALHINTVQLHKHNNLSATTGYHATHIHDIAYPAYVNLLQLLFLFFIIIIIIYLFSHTIVYIGVHNVKCVHFVYNVY